MEYIANKVAVTFRIMNVNSGVAGTHGNGVPTREILRFYCYFYFQMLQCYNIPCTSNHVMTRHQNLQSI